MAIRLRHRPQATECDTGRFELDLLAADVGRTALPPDAACPNHFPKPSPRDIALKPPAAKSARLASSWGLLQLNASWKVGADVAAGLPQTAAFRSKSRSANDSDALAYGARATGRLEIRHVTSRAVLIQPPAGFLEAHERRGSDLAYALPGDSKKARDLGLRMGRMTIKPVQPFNDEARLPWKALQGFAEYGQVLVHLNGLRGIYRFIGKRRVQAGKFPQGSVRDKAIECFAGRGIEAHHIDKR